MSWANYEGDTHTDEGRGLLWQQFGCEIIYYYIRNFFLLSIIEVVYHLLHFH